MEYLSELATTAPFAPFFGDDVTVVPAPRSALHVTGGLWPGHVIASSIVRSRLAREVLPLVRRTRAVPKSAFAAPGERPTVETHYESIEADTQLIAPARLLLVDDVVTRGRTLLACARRLHESFPAAEIRCFALVRTRGLLPEIERILDPCVGRIFWDGADVDREP
jgi:adenine/guanine phosphoribosyltransferase-like PRPP-binding protein